MKKVDVLVIGTIPPELGSNNYGGVAQVVWNISKHLKYESVDFSIGAIGRYFGQPHKIVQGIHIYGVGFSVRFILLTLALFLKKIATNDYHSFHHLIKLCYSVYYLSYISKKVDFDILHVHHVINQVPEAIKILNLDCKIIATIHSYHSIIYHLNSEKRMTEIDNINSQLECVDLVTHVSKAVKMQGRQLGVKWSVDDRVIYNGIELNQKIDSKPSNESDKNVIFVGSLIERKGIKELLESVHYSEIDFELNLVGKGELEGLVDEYLIEKSNTKVKVNKLGIIPNKMVLHEIAESNLLVVPSKSESFGLVYIEALSVGTPVIGYPPIMEELTEYLNLEGDEKKWLNEFDHDLDNPKELAAKIRESFKIKNDPNYLTLSDSIRNKIKKKLSWKSITEDYIKVYNKIGN